MVWDLWCFEDLKEKDRWLTRSISDGGVCRTAPATQGPLIVGIHNLRQQNSACLGIFSHRNLQAFKTYKVYWPGS